MANDHSRKTALDILKQVFSDQPELLNVGTPCSVESQKLIGNYQ
jgi:hypothetical protein